MAFDNFVQLSIPSFDGPYDHWSMVMENFLNSKEYWQVIFGSIEELIGVGHNIDKGSNKGNIRAMFERFKGKKIIFSNQLIVQSWRWRPSSL